MQLTHVSVITQFQGEYGTIRMGTYTPKDSGGRETGWSLRFIPKFRAVEFWHKTWERPTLVPFEHCSITPAEPPA